MSVAITGNLLLKALAPADFSILEPNLERTEVRKGEVLIRQGDRLEFTYFPEGGLSSQLAVSNDGRKIDVGCFGFEGMVSTAALLGSDRAFHEILVQISAPWLRIRTDLFTDVLQSNQNIYGLLARFVQVQMLALSNSVLASCVYKTRERLARCLVMAHDRVQGDDLLLTHQSLSTMLAVRRAGITIALQEIEGLGMIRTKRGLITVLNREKLIDLAGDSYGFPESEYERLIGPFRNRDLI